MVSDCQDCRNWSALYDGFVESVATMDAASDAAWRTLLHLVVFDGAIGDPDLRDQAERVGLRLRDALQGRVSHGF